MEAQIKMRAVDVGEENFGEEDALEEEKPEKQVK